MNCSASLALAKFRFLPFRVHRRDAGCASVYLTLSRCSDLFTDVKVFIFSASSCVMSGNTFLFDPTLFSGRSHYFISCRLSQESDQQWSWRLSVIGHGSERCALSVSNSPPTSIPSPSPRTLFTQLSIVPFVLKVSLSPTSCTLCLLL